jgi:hypothetical protein
MRIDHTSAHRLPGWTDRCDNPERRQGRAFSGGHN